MTVCRLCLNRVERFWFVGKMYKLWTCPRYRAGYDMVFTYRLWCMVIWVMWLLWLYEHIMVVIIGVISFIIIIFCLSLHYLSSYPNPRALVNTDSKSTGTRKNSIPSLSQLHRGLSRSNTAITLPPWCHHLFFLILLGMTVLWGDGGPELLLLLQRQGEDPDVLAVLAMIFRCSRAGATLMQLLLHLLIPMRVLCRWWVHLLDPHARTMRMMSVIS
jgi:hypothetical protein